MSEFESITSYRQFEQRVKTKTRFALDEASRNFLDTVIDTIAPDRACQVPKGRIYFRTQRGYLETTEIINPPTLPPHDDDDAAEEEPFEVLAKAPLAATRMVPTAGHAADGRVNPRGIPCLYLASSASAAISEMRPWVGSYVTLAQFKTTRDCRMVDCSHNCIELSFGADLGGYSARCRNQGKRRMGRHGYAFSKPVNYDEPHLDYVPTQILADAFRNAGFEGIIYRSLLDKGHRNVALFDLEAAELRTRCLYQLEFASLRSAKVESEQSPTTWPRQISSEFRRNDQYLNLEDLR